LDELQELRREELFVRAGLLYAGPESGPIVSGVRQSAQQHDLQVEALDRGAMQEHFPGFKISDDAIALYEPNAGYLQVEKCVIAHIEEAVRFGAVHRTGEAVRGWERRAGRLEVDFGGEIYTADRLIVAGGAWSSGLLSALGVPLRVLRKHLHWFEVDDPVYTRAGACPTFFFETPEGYFYGFPGMDAAGLKVSEHSGGAEIEDPLTDPRELDEQDFKRVGSFLEKYLPGVSRRHSRHEVCFYTMSPDEHFIVDHDPEDAGIVFAAGLSGHGFKMTSVLGEVLAESVLDGGTQHDIDFLRLARLG
jgi:monomeric sarcosine oxidase